MRLILPKVLICGLLCLESMVLNLGQISDVICDLDFFHLATHEEIELEDLYPTKIAKAIEETFLRTMKY